MYTKDLILDKTKFVYLKQHMNEYDTTHKNNTKRRAAIQQDLGVNKIKLYYPKT